MHLSPNVSVNARFSYERRVKLIILSVLTAIAMMFPFALQIHSAEYTEPPARVNLIRTSCGTENYSVFECSGKTITARGRYSPDRVRKMYIEGYEDHSGTYSMKGEEDGSYQSELSMTPEDGPHKLVLKMNYGAILKYLIYFDKTNGWYFPLNGLEKSNREVFEHIYDAPAEAAAIYLSPDADPEEINSVLEQLMLITDGLTEGITSVRDKARVISNFIAKNYYYDHDARESDVSAETIALANVLKTKKTTCAGFANLFCAMAEAAGIDAVNIKGGVTTSEGSRPVSYDELADGLQNHEFAAFYEPDEERWIWVDACWDGTHRYENGEYLDGSVKEMYFDISDDALSFNHRADKAERRRYFSVRTETSILGANDYGDGERLSEVTSQATEKNDPEGSASDPSALSAERYPSDTSSSKEDDTVLLVIIAVLGVCVIAAAVIVVKIILNGRNKQTMVVIELANGKKIKIELYPDIAPETVANFEKLVKSGFYDGLTFHRVIPGFMIQGGCPRGNGTGNSGEHIKGEFSANGFQNDLKHTRGVISMARAADPNSASCQFFIMHDDAPHLDGSYAAFGKVTEGMDAVDEIADTPTDISDKPTEPVIMKKVYME